MVEKIVEQAKDQLMPWTNILVVLSCSHRLAKTFENDSELIHAIILPRWVSVNALARYARKNNEHSWLLNHKDVTDFETRKSLVMMMFPSLGSDPRCPQSNLIIDRSQLFIESFMYVGQVDSHKLHGRISIKFKNEKATGPAVMNEWFLLLIQEIFSLKNGLFLSCSQDRRRFFPNSASSADPIMFEHFRFAGRLIALALRHEFQLGITFDRMFFKTMSIAMKKVFKMLVPFEPKIFKEYVFDYEIITVEDIKDFDPILYASCKKILEMDDDILDSDILGLTFTREIEDQRTRRIIELINGWMETLVDSRSKGDFVLCIIESYIEQFSEQVFNFARGFQEMFSKDKFGKIYFDGLDCKEFYQMLRGNENQINAEDWKRHTIYDGYTNEDQQISFSGRLWKGWWNNIRCHSFTFGRLLE